MSKAAKGAGLDPAMAPGGGALGRPVDMAANRFPGSGVAVSRNPDGRKS